MNHPECMEHVTWPPSAHKIRKEHGVKNIQHTHLNNANQTIQAEPASQTMQKCHDRALYISQVTSVFH